MLECTEARRTGFLETSAMTARPQFTFWLFGAMACSVVGAPPSPASTAPGGGASDYAELSAAARLGIKFEPKTKGAERAYAAPRLAPGTVLLPPYLVTDPRVRLTESEVLTEKGKIEIAENKYLSPLYRAVLGPLSQIAGYYFDPLSILRGWHPNEAEAMTLYRQDERLKMLREMDSLIQLELIGGAREAKQFHRVRLDASELSR